MLFKRFDPTQTLPSKGGPHRAQPSGHPKPAVLGVGSGLAMWRYVVCPQLLLRVGLEPIS